MTTSNQSSNHARSRADGTAAHGATDGAGIDIRTSGEQIGDVERRLLQTFGGPVGEAAVRRSVSMAIRRLLLWLLLLLLAEWRDVSRMRPRVSVRVHSASSLERNPSKGNTRCLNDMLRV